MNTEKKTAGRKSIGPAVTVALPEEVIVLLDEIAERTDRKRAEVVREIVQGGVYAARARAARDPGDMADVHRRRVAPIAAAVASWIGLPDDPGQRRRRFRDWRRNANSTYRLAETLIVATGELALLREVPEGIDPEVVKAMTTRAEEAVDGAEPHLGLSAWRWRAVLWWEVLAELKRRGISVALPDGAEDDEPIEFDTGEDEDLYA